MLIDSHVHLDDPRYDADREQVLARAHDAGIGACITIGCDLQTSRAAVTLADRYPGVYATVGVHPHEVRNIQDGWYSELEQLASHPKVVAYGEIGLDYHYDHSPRDVQRARFREQIQLARQLHLPVIIHTRKAQTDTVSILREEGGGLAGGVFHCFSGDGWLSQAALDLGFYISFSGVITFNNAGALRDLAATVPHDRIMVETDCPYLSPVPYRGKRNEPAHVKVVAQKISELFAHDQECSLEAVARMTTDNARALFKIS